jgi:putative FmdB family regulatory protein
MPIYEYRCAACGHELEALQRITEAPLKQCPECKKSRLKRLISAPSFRLKGGGWYETDFKSDKEKKRNLVESADKKAKSDGDGAKTDVAAKESPPKETKKETPKVEAKESKTKSAPKAAPATQAEN